MLSRLALVLAGFWGVMSAVAAPMPGVPAAAPSSAPQQPASRNIPDGAFVRVQGTNFLIGDHPFRFVGANIDPLHGDINRLRYQEILSALVMDGLTVGRIWALGEGPSNADPWSRKWALFRVGSDGFVEESYQQLDRVLAAARQAGLRLIITLSNNWKDYGGVPMYMRWAGKRADGLAAEEFYSDDLVRYYFRLGVVKLLTRRNSITGVPYVDDPTIFAWELMNESIVLSPRAKEARLHWVREMAQFIREQDKNHLISAGLFGYSMRKERDDWIRIQKLPEVDYADSHIYMQNGEVGVSVQRMYDYLDDRAQLARYVIKKPLVIGEFSFRTDGPRLYLGRPRAEWFERFLLRHFRNQGAGALVWIYEPYWGKPRDFGIYTDRPDTDDVRAVLRRTAARLIYGPLFVPNGRLAARFGSSLLYQPLVVMHNRLEPHNQWQWQWQKSHPTGAQLGMRPMAYFRARFERAGVWMGSPVAHIYGADFGEFVYRFSSPSLVRPPSAIEIEARISSEWPGMVAPADGGSEVEVLVDGALIGKVVAPPDDGIGERRRLRIIDPQKLADLMAGIHTLTFRVPYSSTANGVCIYGAYNGSEPPPAGEFSPILVRYLFGPIKQPLEAITK